MKNWLVAAVTLALSGCVTMGTNYDVAALDKLHAGMSKAEVVDLLGRPNTRSTLPNGSEMLGWVHSKGSAFGASARSVSLQFGADGKLVDGGSRNQLDLK